MKIKYLFKNILPCTLIAAIFLCVGGCKANNTVVNDIEVSMKAKTLSPAGLVLVIENNSDSYDFVYRDDYIIETYVNDTWSKVSTLKNHIVYTIAYIIHPKSSKEMEINWEWIYGELPAGNYRIVKNFIKIKAFDDISNVISTQNFHYYFSVE